MDFATLVAKWNSVKEYTFTINIKKGLRYE